MKQQAAKYFDEAIKKAQEQQFAESIELFNKAIELDKTEVNYFLYRGVAFEHLKDAKKAVLSYKQALKIDPKHRIALNYLTEIYMKTAEYKLAINTLNKIMKLPNPGPELYFNRGLLYTELGEIAKAETDYKKALEINPEYGRAIEKLNNLEHYKTIQEYTELIEKDPKSGESYFMRALAYDSLHKFPQAIADYSKAIELNPKVSSAYLNRGQVKKDMGDIEGALDDYTKAIDVNPNDSLNYYVRGTLRGMIADKDPNSKDNPEAYADALTDFNNAIKLAPNVAKYYFNRGFLFDRTKRYNEALADYTKALELDPHSFVAYNNRGQIKRTLGDIDGAIADFKKALEIEPGAWGAQVNLDGLLKQKEGK
jgi:tetratricopeptide (TPR) repeat protein